MVCGHSACQTKINWNLTPINTAPLAELGFAQAFDQPLLRLPVFQALKPVGKRFKALDGVNHARSVIVRLQKYAGLPGLIGLALAGFAG